MNLLISENPLMVLPTLAERIGLEESIFLQQIHYLTLHSRNMKDGKRWVYNTYADWLEIFPFLKNVDKVKRIVLKLEELGLLVTQKDPTPMNRRKWYRVNYASEILIPKSEQADLPDEQADLPDEQADLPDEQADLPDEQADLPDEQADLPPAINRDFQQRLSANINPYGVAPTAEAADAPPKVLPKKPAKPKTANPDNAKTWEAYRQAYLQRYGVEPIRNAQVNAMIANLVKSVGGTEAPKLAWFYVWHNKGWYVQNRHALKHLIADVQAVRTDWLRNEQMTAQKARQTEQQATTAQVAANLIAKYQAEEERHG
ncbi:hypothetical protein [Neisseria weixii]|uniref:hypothetical protein n=1 Tax=Neisseria weixii TaxID=1853276 RepID=UPI0035A1C666